MASLYIGVIDMTDSKVETKTHPSEVELSDLLCNLLGSEKRELIESHIASCDECLGKIVAAYESVGLFRKNRRSVKGKGNIMKKINPYLVLAIISFLLSFAVPRHFIQLLVATLIFGLKWVVDSKTARLLVMIYDAWKKGADEDNARILKPRNEKHKNRL